MERGWKPNADQVLPACPRCGSSNTKFCYYNNYSLTQPRYFCKGCRRYWTKGGSLRNVPIGGGCRKSRRGKSTRVSSDGGANSRVNGVEFSSNTSFSSPGPDNIPSTSIDLAAVYANFLSPVPTPPVEPELPMPDGVLLPPVEFPSFHNFNTGFIDCGNFPGRLLSESQLIGDGNSMYFNGFDSFQKEMQNSVPAGNSFINPSINLMNNNNASLLLPTLPGHVAVSEGIMWPGSDHNLMLPNDQVDHEAPGGPVEPAGGQNSEFLSGNVSTFSELNLEAIFRS